MIAGIDFGTSNSACCVRLESGEVKQVVLEPGSPFPDLLPSFWYFPGEGKEPMIGRNAKLTFIENEFNGRFITSLKPHLGDESLKNVYIHFQSIPVEAIVGMVLEKMKRCIKDQFGEIDRVYAGRPVIADSDVKTNRIVEDRLRLAYRGAGFPDPVFIMEPVAAAYKYKKNINNPEIVFVADFGGGTLDYCIASLEPESGSNKDIILSTNGIHLGGDMMTAELMRLFREYFGSSSSILNAERTKYIPYPVNTYTQLANWRQVWELNQIQENIEQDIKWGCTDEQALRRLIQLLDTDTHFRFLDKLEETKIELSSMTQMMFLFRDELIDLAKPVTRQEYEFLTIDLMNKAEKELRQTFSGTGLTPGNVDGIFLTGGSSQIPCFREMISRVFPRTPIHDEGLFSSVAVGLASVRE